MCQTPRTPAWQPTRAGGCRGALSWRPGTWLGWGARCCPRRSAPGCGWCGTGRCPQPAWWRRCRGQSPPWTWSCCLERHKVNVQFRRNNQQSRGDDPTIRLGDYRDYTSTSPNNGTVALMLMSGRSFWHWKPLKGQHHVPFHCRIKKCYIPNMP